MYASGNSIACVIIFAKSFICGIFYNERKLTIFFLQFSKQVGRVRSACRSIHWRQFLATSKSEVPKWLCDLITRLLLKILT